MPQFMEAAEENINKEGNQTLAEFKIWKLKSPAYELTMLCWASGRKTFSLHNVTSRKEIAWVEAPGWL